MKYLNVFFFLLYLDSRSGPNRIDSVNSAGFAVVMVIDVAAVHRKDKRRTAGPYRNQEEQES